MFRKNIQKNKFLNLVVANSVWQRIFWYRPNVVLIIQIFKLREVKDIPKSNEHGSSGCNSYVLLNYYNLHLYKNTAFNLHLTKCLLHHYFFFYPFLFKIFSFHIFRAHGIYISSRKFNEGNAKFIKRG